MTRENMEPPLDISKRRSSNATRVSQRQLEVMCRRVGSRRDGKNTIVLSRDVQRALQQISVRRMT